MPIHDKYYTGTTVSRDLPPGERGFASVVYQSGKPVLDSELNLNQEVRQQIRSLLADRGIPSGFTRGQTRYDALDDFAAWAPTDPGFTPDAFMMRRLEALVGGFPVVIEYTDTPTAGWNVIQLSTAPVFGGAPPDIKRTDFVFLEVWQALVQDSPNATGTVQVLPALPAPGDTIVLNGTPLTAVAGAPAVDQFTIGATQATTAANIFAAINNPANSFAAFVSAKSDGVDTVTITSVVSGAAGNAITLSVTGAALVASGPVLAGGADEPNKPTQDTIYRHGNNEADPLVNLPDDLADPVIGIGTAMRVQVQYRIRKTGQSEAVSFKSEADGFSNPNIVAQGGQAAPVVTYPFVKADNTTVLANSDATAYGYEDNGLWIAGDGSSASAAALGTLDGYVYAIPIAFVFRRNDAYIGGAGAGWEPLSNTNGGLPSTHGPFANPSVGLIPAGLSDRPDDALSDGIQVEDIQDLRYHIAQMGFDLAAELQYQMQSLLDGANQTWAIDAADKNTLGAGSGDVSTQFLVCNQVGRDAGHGGTSPTSGSTTRGDTIRNFDHVSRRFGDQPVVELLVLSLIPTDTAVGNPGKYVVQANGGYAGWAEDDVLHLDLNNLNASTLGDWDFATATFFGFGPGNASVMDFAPPGTMITDVRTVKHDDGHFTTAVDQNTQIKTVIGLGTGHVEITLDVNTQTVNGGDSGNPNHRMVGDVGLDDGSERRIFIELEVTYPLGSGITDTPDVEVVPDSTVWPRGPILENQILQRPDDWDDLLAPRFREGFREVAIEYIANDGSGMGSGTPIVDEVVSADPTFLRFPRRVFGSSARVVGVTDMVAAQPHNVDEGASEYGSSSRVMQLITGGGTPPDQPLSGAGQTLCSISYFAQDPTPNWGAAGGGYQVGVYYRSNAPQTVGTQAGPLLSLPDPLTVEPLVTLDQVYSGQVGMGSVDLAFPYVAPLDQIPCNDNGAATFPKEWYFAATAQVSISDFNATTGMINLHAFVPMDGTGEIVLASRDKDNEFRAMFKGIGSGYRPSSWSQDLSNVTRHKNWTAMLARATADSELFRKNEVLLIVVTRFAELDAENFVGVTDTDNRTCAAVYRTRNRLVIVGD